MTGGSRWDLSLNNFNWLMLPLSSREHTLSCALHDYIKFMWMRLNAAFSRGLLGEQSASPNRVHDAHYEVVYLGGEIASIVFIIFACLPRR